METYNMEDVREETDTCHSLLRKEGVGDSTRYNHFMTFFRVEGRAVGQAQVAVPQL